MVKAFGTEVYESRRFRDAARRLLRSNLRYVLQQAISSPLIEMFGALTIVRLADLRAHPDQDRRPDRRRVHQLRDRAADAVRAVKRLTGIHNIFQQAIGASQKVFEYLDHPEEIEDKPGAAKLARFEHGVIYRRRQLPLSELPTDFSSTRSGWK